MQESFKSRVQKFWKSFSQEEHIIRELMDNSEEIRPETLINFVDNTLQIAFNKSYFEMGINKENKYELILTPEGDRAKLIQLHYWLQQAPEHLWEKWNFYASKPGKASPGSSLTMYDIDLKEDDITIYPEIDTERKKINIEVYAPKLMTLEENQRYSMFFIYLDQFIGELYTMEYIGYIDFVTDPLEKESVAISDLISLVDKAISENEWFTFENPCEVYSGYQLKPNEEEGWKLREDVYIGMTSCAPAINCFLKEDDSLIEEFKADGLILGFLFYENINVPKEQMVPFRSEIEDKIMNIVKPQGIADSIGGATGFHFSYIDWYVYDFDAFIKVAKEVLSNYNMEEVGFCEFSKKSNPMLFS